MNKYRTLLNILDAILEEAPEGYKTFKPEKTDEDLLNQARAKAFIHLYLKVKYGMANFLDRHNNITEGSQDGGIDAYYLDQEKKRLYLFQSKFRTSAKNFEEKSITAEELVRMEIVRVLKGEKLDSNGVEYNSKIKELQTKWGKISDHANYEYIVVILGNLTRYNDAQIKRLIDNSKYEIFNFEKIYNELVFPLNSGTYYEPKEIRITIDLANKEQSTLKQKISTQYGEFDVRVIFVPTIEIGKILSKYKNSLLRYNPRNYLSLSRNKVNINIRNSITMSENNDFAILNNGITIIADSFQSTESTGKKDVGQIIMTSPQIINGGQTAYTLCKIYEDKTLDSAKIFRNKEVMLKVIISKADIEKNLKFIEDISNATNQQTKVEEADRRSNEQKQVLLQERLFNEFGYFYERKRGEFYNGLDNKYVRKDQIIDRSDFLRSFMAFKGNPADARRTSGDVLFKSEKYHQIVTDVDLYKNMLFAHLTLMYLNELDKPKAEKDWGSGLRFGKMAIIAAISYLGVDEDITDENIHDIIIAKVDSVKRKWKSFEKWVSKRKSNKIYFEEGGTEFNGYYKGKTLDKDMNEYFSVKK